jgi:hypothetical protein
MTHKNLSTIAFDAPLAQCVLQRALDATGMFASMPHVAAELAHEITGGVLGADAPCYSSSAKCALAVLAQYAPDFGAFAGLYCVDGAMWLSACCATYSEIFAHIARCGHPRDFSDLDALSLLCAEYAQEEERK